MTPRSSRRLRSRSGPQVRTAEVSRRNFLQTLGAIGAIGASSGALLGCSASSPPPGPDSAAAQRAAENLTRTGPQGADPVGRRLPGAIDDRILVVVDLQGGNDGLSTLSPIDDPILTDLRPTLGLAPEDILALDDSVGLHPALTRLHGRGITTVEGVGPIAGDLSHFAMSERWQRGDVEGSAGLRNGFLGRLADALDDGSPLVGLSVTGNSPSLLTERAATMSLGGSDDLWFLQPDQWFEIEAYRSGLSQIVEPVPRSPNSRPAELIDVASASYRQLLDLAVDLQSAGGAEVDWSLPMLSDGGRLGQGLYLAAELLAADAGVRVIYAADGDYDTHQGHQWRQQDNLSRLDAAVGGFLERIDRLGFGDRVLVATVSEFGRRVAENDNGLDHGSASTMLVAGPVADRRLGDRPPLDDLDDDGNLRVTVGFDRYLAALAEQWLGIEAASVLPGQPSPIDLI